MCIGKNICTSRYTLNALNGSTFESIILSRKFEEFAGKKKHKQLPQILEC